MLAICLDAFQLLPRALPDTSQKSATVSKASLATLIKSGNLSRNLCMALYQYAKDVSGLGSLVDYAVEVDNWLEGSQPVVN
jgi:hypothetical protein